MLFIVILHRIGGRKACALDIALALYVREGVYIAFLGQWYGNGSGIESYSLVVRFNEIP